MQDSSISLKGKWLNRLAQLLLEGRIDFGQLQTF